MTVWVYRTRDHRPHWSSVWRYTQQWGNYDVTTVVTEEHAAMMRAVFSMTTDEWCNMRVLAGLPMYPPKQHSERDTRYSDAVDGFLVGSVQAVTP